ncbi:MAG: ABC transporter substrate-binding protein [Candidatus Nanopelagicales bacterium]
MAPEPQHRPAREVLVDADGTVRGAARTVASVPDGLVPYVTGFLSTRHPHVAFVWRVQDGAWVTVRLERQPSAEGRPESARLRWTPTDLPEGLTAREVDVLTLVCLGLTNQQVAARLGTSARTVSTQVERLLTKLGQAGRAGLAAVTVESDLLRLPIPGGVGLESGLALIDVERAVSEPVRDEKRTARRSAPRLAPLHIGSVLPLTGPAWADGLEAQRGAELAVAQINARGGIGGRRVEQVVVPADFFDRDQVVSAFRTLVDLEVDAIITSYANSEVPDVLDLVADFGQPFLHNATFEAQVERVRNDRERFGMVFQTCPSEIHYGVGAIRLLDELTASGRWRPRSRSIVAVEVDLDSGHTANASFFAAAERSGWDVADVVTVPFHDPDWHSVVSRVNLSDPAAVMVTHFVAQGMADFQHAFRAIGNDALVYGVYGPSIPHFADEARDAAEGLIWSTVTGTYDDEFGRAFRRDFERLHGTPAGWSQAGGAYDQVNLLSAAWATTGTPSAPEVLSFLRSTVYRGVNGVYYLGGSGQTALSYPDVTLDPSLGQAHMVFQVQDGTSRLLGPAPYGDVSAFRTPPWAGRRTA